MKINWPRILMFVFVFCFLVTDNPLRKKVFGPTEVHKTMYVSHSFDDEDYKLIQEAADEWNTETHGVASITIVKGYDDYLFNKISDDQSSLVIMRAGIWNPVITSLDAQLHTTILGYFFGESETQIIIVVPARMEGIEYYRGVIMHEMGHAMALSHLDEDDTVMVSSMDRSSYHLSKKDIDWFCRVYYCDASKLGGL